MFFKSRCYNGGSRHKFRARHTEVPMEKCPIPDHVLERVPLIYGSEVRGLMIYDRYVGEVCEWCGKTVEQEKK